MSHGFRLVRGELVATFGVDEVRVLRSLLGEIVELIRNDAPEQMTKAPEDSLAALIGDLGSTEPPEDAVLARLFPSAYTDDEEAAGEFRRFTEHGLRDQKVNNAQVVLDSLGDPAFSDQVTISLDPDEAQSWLRTLADLRLALGTRLGVEQDDEDDWAALPPESPRRQVYAIYHWLGYLQESLVNNLW